MYYSTEERMFIVECYRQVSLRKVRDSFQARFPNSKTPVIATVAKIVKQFQDTGSVEAIKRTRNKKRHILTEEKQQQLLEIAKTHANISYREIASMAGVSASTVKTFFRRENVEKVPKNSKHKTSNIKPTCGSEGILMDFIPKQEEINIKTETQFDETNTFFNVCVEDEYTKIKTESECDETILNLSPKDGYTNIQTDETDTIWDFCPKYGYRKIKPKPLSENRNKLMDLQPNVKHRINKRKRKPKKTNTFTDLSPEEQEQRNIFCDVMFEKLNNDNLLINKILFNDIATFYIRKNMDSWEIEYSNFYSLPSNNYSIKVNIWTGLIGFNIVGPFFIDGDINCKNYLQLLQRNILPALNELNFNHKETWYQHTGIDSKFIRDLLNSRFQDRIIGLGGIIQWPNNSADLHPVEYFYWKYIKKNMFNLDEINNSQQLEEKVFSITETMKPLELYNVINEFYDRINYCLVVNGGRFEDIINNNL